MALNCNNIKRKYLVSLAKFYKRHFFFLTITYFTLNLNDFIPPHYSGITGNIIAFNDSHPTYYGLWLTFVGNEEGIELRDDDGRQADGFDAVR